MGEGRRARRKAKAEAGRTAGKPPEPERLGQLERLLGTPLEIEADGKKYLMAPLSFVQMGEMEAWAKRQPFVELAEQLKILRGVDGYESMQADLYEKACAATRDERAIARYMESVGGRTESLRRSLRTYQPEITDAEVNKILSVNGALQIGRKLSALTGPAPEDAPEPDPPKGEAAKG